MRRSTPDRSELEHWRADHVTVWIMGKLAEQFRPLRPSQLAASWEDQHLRAGHQQVIEAIDKLTNGNI